LGLHLKDKAGEPWFAALTAVLGGVAGLLGSVFSQEIKGAIPFSWPEIVNQAAISAAISWQAALFWIALGLFGYCFKVSIGAQTTENRDALDKLTRNTEKLEVLIRTLPDEAFLSKFEDYYKLAFSQANLAIRDGADNTDIVMAIIGCLNALGHLARLFDGRDSSFRYAIHVMIFQPIPAEQSELDKIMERVRFFESNSDPRKWRGILDLNRKFAQVMEPQGHSAHDSHVTAFALPVPSKEHRDEGNLSTVLPGPVEAFCYPGRMVKLADTSQLSAIVKKNCGFRASVSEEIAEYFSAEPGNQIKSLVSLPFGSSEDMDEGYENEPFGVINIHSSEADILKGDGVKLFFPLTAPFRMMLAELFKKLQH
jgi:hypothetical protein